MSNTSFYLYQKYIKIGSQDWIPVYPAEYAISGDAGQTPVIKQENDPNCGYYQPQYRWHTLPITEDFVCSGGNKYYEEIYQVSYDNGFNWENVVPEQTRQGSIYESGSVDCAEYRWVNLDISTDYICDGTTKYYKQKKQYSLDGGVTWYDVVPAEYQKGELYEYDSEDCHDYSKDYLTFIPISGNSTFTFYAPIVASGNTVYYSLDSGSTWNSMTSGQTVTVNQGNKIYWKATGLDCSNGIGLFYSTTLGDAGLFDIEGNIMSLVAGDDFESATTISPNQFKTIFSQSQAVNTENLVLPATTLASKCYYDMFRGCTSLTTAPSVLPATTLASNCYANMFNGCTALATAPELPATTLAESCYSWMFRDCTSLTTAPELPATTLASQCYYNMFNGCISLTTAPQLPATTLANNCYESMFYNCTSLTTAPSVLPATTLASQCYYDMFRGCTSLTTAPELPATTLAVDCYRSMFQGCTSLTTAPELPATTLATYCYGYMFYGCTSLTTAPVLSATTLADRCYYGMFWGCTSLITAPELPATALADYCYVAMFRGCTSLATAPQLPATTLANNCYQGMFSGCTNMNYIKCLATDISASNCTTNWVSGVANSGTFTKASTMTSWATGNNGIPNNWTVQNA